MTNLANSGPYIGCDNDHKGENAAALYTHANILFFYPLVSLECDFFPWNFKMNED